MLSKQSFFDAMVRGDAVDRRLAFAHK